MNSELNDILNKYRVYNKFSTPTELCHIMKKHGSDKGLGMHNYTTLYHEIFQSYRNDAFRLLEVGRAKNGASLHAWQEYFPHANIIGADSTPLGHFKPVYVFDQHSSDEIHSLFRDRIVEPVDIIIDDAFHDFYENWNMFIHSIQYLNQGGLYFIEDLTIETMEKFLHWKEDIMTRFQIDVFDIIEIPYYRNKYDNRICIMRKCMIPKLNIITCMCASDCKSMINFLHSILIHSIKYDGLYIYTLSMDHILPRIIHDMFQDVSRIHIRKFDFKKYPLYEDIKSIAGSYVCKCILIEEIAQEIQDGLLLWCDVGNMFLDNLSQLCQYMITTDIYSPSSTGTIIQWTYPMTCKVFGIELINYSLHLPLRNTSIICFHLKKEIQEFIQSWVKLSMTRECISPDGCDSTNHAFDQSIFSLLYYQYKHKNPLYMRQLSDIICMSIHKNS